MSALNLHNIVRGAITSIHPDESITYYQSTGQRNVAGIITSTYAEAIVVKAQIQNDNDAALFHADRAGMNTSTIKAYLYADEEAPPAGIVRPFGRTGDMFKRSDGTWWLVSAVVEDFKGVGWTCVRATLQVKPPAGIAA